MPISSPLPARNSNRSRAGNPALLFSAACLLFACIAAPGQTLAHPGLVGNGLNTEAWWQHAVIYEIASKETSAPAPTQPAASPADYKAVTAKLDALRAMGVDALLLPPPELPAQAVSAAARPATPAERPDASNPTLDEFDELIHQASRRGIRVLIQLAQSSSGPDLFAAARFWLTRGAAGFHFVTPPGANPQDVLPVVQALRKVTNGVVGQRILLSDYIPGVAADTAVSAGNPQPRVPQNGRSQRRSSRSAAHIADTAGAQLQIDSRPGTANPPDAATLRALLNQTIAQRNVVLDIAAGAPDSPSLPPKTVAALAMATHPAALIDADEEVILKNGTVEPPKPAEPAPPPPPPAHPVPEFAPYVPAVVPRAPVPPIPPTPRMIAGLALANWYTELAALRHGNATLRYGSTTMLDFDAQNTLVFVTRPVTNSPLTPPVVMLCNLSAAPVQLSLSAAMKALGLHGFFLRTLLRSDNGMGAQSLDSVNLPPFAVYIGELGR